MTRAGMGWRRLLAAVAVLGPDDLDGRPGDDTCVRGPGRDVRASCE